MAMLNRLSDLITPNLLWLLCCLPVFTIGLSTSALYMVLQSSERKEAPVRFPAFFKAFHASFRQTFLISLIPLISIALTGVYLFLSHSGALGEEIKIRDQFFCISL